jgi:hypothetical protein
MLAFGTALAVGARPVAAGAQGAPARDASAGAAARAASRFPAGRYTLTLARADVPDQPQFAGDWALRFAPDRTYELSYLTTTGPRPMVVGKYAVAGRRLTLFDDARSSMACTRVDANAATGIYTWEVRGPQLVLHVVKDDCVGRRGGLVRPWTRVPDSASRGAPTPR